MNFNERLNRITERHEALMATVEILTRELSRLTKLASGLLEIAMNHEHSA